MIGDAQRAALHAGSAEAHGDAGASSLPPPFPSGWFALCFSRELLPGGLLHGTWFGRPLVAYRTASGRPVVIDAHCPHMGAHLGHGGRVRGELLECPFHGFRFDPEGTCVATPYQSAPPRARTTTWPCVERQEAVLVWFDAAGRAPFFQIPESDAGPWSGFAGRTWSGFRGHPQEVSENSVDWGHFPRLHGYGEVQVLAAPVVDGPVLRTRYVFTRDPLPLSRRRLRVEIDVHVRGLGYSEVEASIPSHGLRSRQLVLATPTAAGQLELRIAASVLPMARANDLWPGLGLLPRRLVTLLVRSAVRRGFIQDVEHDLAVWPHKRYLPRPRLAKEEAAVAIYRRWCRQFYAEPEPCAGAER